VLHEKVSVWIFVALCVTLFAVLTLCVRYGTTQPFDLSLLQWLTTFKNNRLDAFFSYVTWFGSLWVLIPLTGCVMACLYYFKHPSLALFFGGGFLSTIAITYLLKYALDRERPNASHPLFELPLDPSFPSAHTAQIVAFTLLMWFVMALVSFPWREPILALCVVLSLCVAVSRAYLQAHFPTDIIGGILIATASVCLSYLVLKKGDVSL